MVKTKDYDKIKTKKKKTQISITIDLELVKFIDFEFGNYQRSHIINGVVGDFHTRFNKLKNIAKENEIKE